MSQRKHSFVSDESYHLYNRGVEKRKIFLDRGDYDHFLFLLYVCNTDKSIKIRDIGKGFERGTTILDIGAYCLMPNHFHLLVRGKNDTGISNYMLKVTTAYSMYFNKKYQRTGTLFEGTFKSVHCGDDRYLKYLYSYIHLNPAKLIDKNWREAKSEKRPDLLQYVLGYRYSSLVEYLGEFHIINPTPFPGYFSTPEDYQKELFEWLSTDTQGNPV